MRKTIDLYQFKGRKIWHGINTILTKPDAIFTICGKWNAYGTGVIKKRRTVDEMTCKSCRRGI